MGRYIITTRRALRGTVTTASEAVKASEGIRVLSAGDPDCITVEGPEEALDRLRTKLGDTYFVEPEVRRSLH